jgi:Dehydroquinase class II
MHGSSPLVDLGRPLAVPTARDPRHEDGEVTRTVIAVLNWPNLNLLGEWEFETYGSITLVDVKGQDIEWADPLGHDVDFRQNNHQASWSTGSTTCARPRAWS